MKKFLLLIVSLMLLVASFGQTTLNESFENGFPPTGWTTIGSQWTIDESNAVTGSKSAFCNYSWDGHNSYLITPQLELNGAYSLIFHTAVNYTGYEDDTEFTIEVSTTGTAAADFTPIYTVQHPNTQYVFNINEVDLSPYNGQTVYIAFHIEDMNGCGFYLDDVALEAAPTCIKPSNLSVTNITTNAATIGWNAPENASAYTVQYKEASVEDWTNATTIESTETSAELTSLSPATVYNVRVKCDCGADDGESVWSEVKTFYTDCVPMSVFPVTYGFEAPNVAGTANYPLPICFARVSSGLYPYTNQYEYYAHTGSYSLSWGYSSSGTVALPEIDPEVDINSIIIEFYARSSSGTSKLEVGVLANDADESSFVPVYTIEPMSSTYTKYVVPFVNFEGEGGRLAFKGSAPSDYIYLDDLTIDVIGDCSEPAMLTAVPDEAEENMLLSWYSTSSNIDLHYKLTTESSYTTIPGVALNEDGVFALSEFAYSSAYNWYLSAICGDDTINSTVSIFTTPCKPISSLPKAWDFEAGNNGGTASYSLPVCWTRSSGNYPYVYSGSGLDNSKCLNFYNYNSGSYGVIGQIDESIDINTLQLTFFLRLSSDYYEGSELLIGVMTDPTDVSTFTAVQTLNNLPTEYTMFEVPFSSYEGEGRYIALKNANGSGYNYSSTYIDNLTLEQIPGCQRPSNLTATGITTEQAVLNWTSDADQYNVYYKDVISGGGYQMISNVSVSEDGYVLAELLPGKIYDWYVEAICSDGTHPASVVNTFITECVDIEPEDLPYIMGFESYPQGVRPSCWTAVESYSGTYDYPYISNSSTPHSGEANLYFYPYGYSGYNNLIALPRINEDLSELRMTFWLRPGSNSDSYGQMQVGYITNLNNPSTFVPLTTIVASELLSSNYAKYVLSFAGTEFEGTDNYIAFKCTNQWGYQWYLDDVVVEYIPDCAEPTNLAANAITSNSANLSWNSQAEEFMVYFKKSTEEEYTSVEASLNEDGVYVLENLEPATTYNWYVETICDGGETAESQPAAFTTQCTPLTQIPITWNFDTISVATSNPLPACWSRLGSQSYPYIYSYALYAHSGAKSLFWSYGYSSTVVLPTIDTEAHPINTLQLRFYARNQYASTSTKLTVGVLEDATNLNTFTEIITLDLTDTYQEFEVPFIQYNGSGAFFAIKATNNSDYIMIDDLTIEPIPECSKPQGLAASVTSSSANLSWSSSGENFLLYVKKATDAEYTSEVVTLNENGVYLLEDLEEATTYNWYVATLCEDDTLVSNNIMTFTTLCLPIPADELPYTMDFEGLSYGSVPTCWTVLESYTNYSGTYPSVEASTFDAHGGTNLFVFYPYGYNGLSNMVALPNINEDIHELRVNFWLRPYNNTASYGQMIIGVMSDLNDMSTFEPVDTIVAAELQSPDYDNYRISFANTTLEGNTNYIVFRAENENGYEWYLDDVVIEYIPNCLEPENLTTVAVTTNSATLSWTSSETNFNLYYKLDGDEEYTAVNNVTLNEDGQYVLANILPGSKYFWYVEADCGASETASSNVRFFVTDCELISTVPQTWDFTTDLYGGTPDYPLPVCWDRILGADSYYTYPYVSNGELMFYMYVTKNYAVLPRINTEVLDINDLMLSMNVRCSQVHSSNKLEVGVMSDPSDLNTFTLVQEISEFTENESVVEVMFENLTNAGDYIAIRTRSNSSYNYNYIYISSLSIYPKPACDPIDLLTANEVLQTTAAISWTGNNEQGYTIQYKEMGGGEWTQAGTTMDTFYTVNNLLPGKFYTIGVAPVCGDEFVVYRNVDIFTLCEVVSEYPYKESFEGTSYGCWENEQLNSKDWQFSGSYSSDGLQSIYFPWNVGASARLISPIFDLTTLTEPTLSYDVYIPVYSYSGTYDSIGVFYRTDASAEWTFIQGNCSDAADDFTTFTVELPEPNATYQIMFLGIGQDGLNAYLDNVNIFDADSSSTPECVVPTALAVNNISETAATATWTAGGEETAWKLQYKTAAATSWGSEIDVITTPSYQMTGLTAGTEYQVRVKAVCGEGDESQWTEAFAFTTNEEVVEPCSTPTNVAASNITKESMTITWSANGASKWNLQYRVVNGTWSTVTVEGNPTYTITDLTEATEYQIQVQAVCDGATSPWSTMISQSTGINARLMGSISLYPNPASNYVDVRVSDNDIAVSRLEVYDVYGKLINEVEVIENPTRINVENLASGMYFVKVITNDGVATKNFIKK